MSDQVLTNDQELTAEDLEGLTLLVGDKMCEGVCPLSAAELELLYAEGDE